VILTFRVASNHLKRGKLMSFQTWLLLLFTCTGACIVPGPNALLIISHVTRYGLKKTRWTIAGGLLGFTVLILISVLGLGSLLESMPTLFNAVKVVGSIYLAVIGLQLINSPPSQINQQTGFIAGDNFNLFKQGFISAVTNVNALMFFISLIPSFMTKNHSLLLQAIIIVLTLTFTEFCFEYALAKFFVRWDVKSIKMGKLFNQICGCLFILFAILLQLK